MWKKPFSNQNQNSWDSVDDIPASSIPSSKLKTTTDADKIQLANLSSEVINSMGSSGGTATLTTGSVNYHTIAESGVRIQNIIGTGNINLFNSKEQVIPNIIDNNFIGGNGVLYANTSYFVTSKVPMIPNTTYTISDINSGGQVGAFYKSDDTFLANITTDTFTAPSNVAYARFSVHKGRPYSTAMLIIGSSLPSAYLPYGSEIDWLKLNPTQLSFAGNRWFGKKMNSLGDSITIGNQTPGIGYPERVGQALGLSVVRNYGISGSTLGEGTGQANPMTLRYMDMDNDADIITFTGGTNDVALINNLGTFGDTTPTSFYGALDVLINGLINKYPDKLLIGLTAPRRSTAGYGSNLGNYALALKKMCEKYCIPCLDMFNDFGMNPTIPAHNTAYMGDGVHHNEKGKQVIADKLAGFIRTQ